MKKELPAKLKRKKMKHGEVKNREETLGRNTEILAEHAEMQLGK